MPLHLSITTHLIPFLFLLLLLNNPATTAAVTLPPSHPINCNTPSSPPSLHPATFSACLRLLKAIPAVHPVMPPTHPLKWSADPSTDPDFGLPARWESPGQCAIQLDMKDGERGWDRSNLADLKDAAMAVAVGCVIRPPHLGGWVNVGWEGKMMLAVWKGEDIGRENGTVESS
ncbi:MAG: hypothetical protein LQ338_004010 [Usnochroma carphineum]|nr:MAG: hypothetical protein LQ338_004010 [Usnochroma carphineum]